ncbi:Rpr2-domain-containing protein [Dendrothele bispora CBS 962.96]|uniref:Rpr2-domain-containing protein n=1 Tax=Dendrothele bispora (strain CBS 962.96) TaxID=1314807 RepID=A0A4S8LAX1_DENBC|nr:Rpr2-domain-containing protein [Dendrothele bispora CBS 962.96]
MVKAKNDAPGPNNAANRDIIQRLNFLYQASVYLNSVNTTISSQPTHDRTDASKKKARLDDISRSYIDTMKLVGTRTTVKMDPSVKRTLCRGCNNVLIPGSTVLVRTKKLSSHGRAITYTCTNCKYSRRIPAPLSETDKTLPACPPDSSTMTEPDVSKSNLRKKERRKKRIARPPPLFARTGVHVVYRGNEPITEDLSQGNGIYIA